MTDAPLWAIAAALGALAWAHDGPWFGRPGFWIMPCRVVAVGVTVYAVGRMVLG